MQAADCDEYTEKYSRGRRGAPAKGVGRLYRRESSNLSFSANAKSTPRGVLFALAGKLSIDRAGPAREGRTRPRPVGGGGSVRSGSGRKNRGKRKPEDFFGHRNSATPRSG